MGLKALAGVLPLAHRLRGMRMCMWHMCACGMWHGHMGMGA